MKEVIVLTGASGGIGKAIAMQLAGPEKTLWLIGRNRGRLESVAAMARGAGGDVRCVAIDLSADEAIADLADLLRRDAGYVDCLIHSAGEIVLGTLESAAIDGLDRQYRINVRAPCLLTQLLLPMLRAQAGQVVFINSSAAQIARRNNVHYAATKHALRAIADGLRETVNADGMRVLSVYPGRTATPMQALVHAMEGTAYQPEQLLQPEDVAAVVVNALRLPRSAEVTDIHVRPSHRPGAREPERCGH